MVVMVDPIAAKFLTRVACVVVSTTLVASSADGNVQKDIANALGICLQVMLVALFAI